MIYGFLQCKKLMNIVCERNLFANAISNVIKASSPKAVLPVLEGVLLKANKNSVELCCFDLKIAIKRTIAANVIEEGEIVLSASTLNNIASSIKSETITITTDTNLVANIKGGRSKFKVAGISPSDFPLLPEVNREKAATVSALEFKNNLKQSLFAATTNNTNPIFAGVNINLKNGSMIFRATDSYKFIKRTIPATGDDFNCIISAKESSDIVKIIPDNIDNISLYVSTSHAVFIIEDYTVITRLVAGTFPDFKAIEEKKYESAVIVNCKDLLNTIHRVSLVNIDRLPKPMICSITNKTIDVSTNGYLGNSEDTCDLISFSGKEITIGLSSKHLESILANISDENIKIEFSDERTPITIKPVEKNNFLAFMAPMVVSA